MESLTVVDIQIVCAFFFKYKFVGSPSTVNFIRIYYSIIFEFVIQLTMKSMKISAPQNIMKSTPKRQSQITCH